MSRELTLEEHEVIEKIGSKKQTLDPEDFQNKFTKMQLFNICKKLTLNGSIFMETTVDKATGNCEFLVKRK